MENLSTYDSKQEAAEILISAFRVTHPASYTSRTRDIYEFILNDEMHLIDCFKVLLPARGIRKNIKSQDPLEDQQNLLEGLLFELHHVRVNPKRDNTKIIQRLITTLDNIGVPVQKQPTAYDMRICYKPLGEICECVRFYLSGGNKLIFLCPTKGPRLIAYRS